MTVFKGYMKIIKRNLGLLLLYLSIFFAVTTVFRMAASEENYSNFHAKSVKIGLVDEDGGPLAKALADYLGEYHDVKQMENEPEELQEDLFYRNVEYIVWIPHDFYKTCVRDGEDVSVTKVPGSYTSFYVDQQMNSFLNNAKSYSAAGFTEKETAKAVKAAKTADVTMLDTSGNGGGTPGYSFYFQFIPYLFLAVLCYAMGNIISAFRKGDLPKRMQASAVPGRRQSLEGLLAMAAIGMGLWLISVAGAVVQYGKEFLECAGMGYYLANALLMLWVGLAIAYLVGMFAKDTNMLNGIVNVISLGMSFLCGVFVPMEVMNKNVLKAAQFLPVYWYEKVNDTLAEYGTVTGGVRTMVLRWMGIEAMFAAALVCVILAVSKLMREG